MTEVPGESAATLQDLLPRTGSAFFGRFRRFTPVQRVAIQPILDGTDVLVVAPTATGKTEAVMAPLIERHVRAHLPNPVILYIAPTRALVNDAFRRLEAPLERLRVTIGRKTSDHPTISKDPPAVLVTTPESLDSMLVRRTGLLMNVRAVLLDELHNLDGGPRGDQLACLIVRLRHVVSSRLEADGTEGRIQVIAASATVDQPAVMAGRYLESAAVAKVGGQRILKHRMVPFSDLAGALADSVADGRRKVLAFANARAVVESSAAAMAGRRPFGEDVYAHHGSLSRDTRERTESRFLAARRALCAATMTLELGIDIGDVDVIVLLQPPHSVSALLQRAGRAGRRGQDAEVIAVAASGYDRIMFEHLFYCARRGELHRDAPVYDPSVALQQALSVCLQNKKHEVDAAGLLKRMPEWQRAYWTRPRLRTALARLVESDHLAEVAPGVFGETADLVRLRRLGTVHGNIARDGEVPVIDELTHRQIGTVAAAGGPGAKLALGGRNWRVTGGGVDSVRVAGSAGSGPPVFAAQPVPFQGRRLALSLKQKWGYPPEALLRLQAGDVTHFFHALGGAWGAAFRWALEGKKAGGLRLFSAWGASLKGPVAAPGLNLDINHLEDAVRHEQKRLSCVLPFGPYFRLLPPEEQFLAIRQAFCLEEFTALASRFEVVEADSLDLAEKLRLFMAS